MRFLKTDVKILFKTVGVVLGQKGIAFNKEDAITAKAEEEPIIYVSEKEPAVKEG